MEFINTFFNAKIGAVGLLFKLTKSAWDDRMWSAVVLMVLWTMVCTIGGMILLPIDIVWCAIMWYKSPVLRHSIEEIEDEMTLN